MPGKKKKSTGKSRDGKVYLLKVTLLGSDPSIWRRIQVLGNTTLEDLHYILQWTMGWENAHLHQFEVDGVYYSDAEFGLEDVKSERRVRLCQVAPHVRKKFLYEYDFGDGWQHEIIVEKILPREQVKEVPVCLEGERACPPEDCGGVWGYYDFLDAIADPHHEEHQDILDWIGGKFDPEAFDPTKVNRALKRMKLSLA